MENQKRLFTPAVRVMSVFAIYFLLTFGGLIPLSLLVGGENPTEFQANLIRLLACALYTAVFLIFVKVVDRRSVSILRLQFDRNAGKAFLTTFVFVGAIIFLSAFISVTFLGFDRNPPQFSFGRLLSGIMAAFVLQGFPEELAFRGVMPETFESTPKKTLWTTSILFMLLHVHFIPPYIEAFRENGELWLLFDLAMELYYPFIFSFFAFEASYLFKSLWAAVAVHGGIHIFRIVTDEFFGVYNGGARTIVTNLLFTIAAIVVYLKYKDRFNPENNTIRYE